MFTHPVVRSRSLSAAGPHPRRRRRPSCGALFAVSLLLAQPLAPAIIVVEGACNLPDAIRAANRDATAGDCPAGSGADELLLTGDATLTGALPKVVSTITIEGGGFSVHRDPAAGGFRIFTVYPDYYYSGFDHGDLTLNDIRIENGTAFIGGAILVADLTFLTLNNATISSNTADRGGAIYNERSTVTINDSVIENNSGQAVYGFAGSTRITNSAISGNSADFAITQMFGSMTLNGSTLSENSGGGVATCAGFASLVNSTVSGNSGRALSAYYFSDIEVTNTTLSGNGSGVNGGYESAITLKNSLIANSGGANCSGDIEDEGGNLDDDGTCGAGFGVLTGLDPLLADHGGPTLTHALLAGSSAIDAAGDCGLATDQRGSPRDDGACDSGAYEFQQPEVEVAVDVRPAGCPNPLNTKSRGTLPVAIAGTSEFDVTQIDPASVLLAGVAPRRWDIADVATPFEPFLGKDDVLDCTEEGPDGLLDLGLVFDTQAIVEALGPVEDGAAVVLPLTGTLLPEFGGTPIVGEDVVLILKKGKE